MGIVIREVEIENFHRVERLTFRFDQVGFHLVYGENGSGKSTIFEALTWGLYGRCARGRARPGDDVVRPDADYCRVCVLFALDDGSEYGVERYRGKKENYLLLTRNGEEEERVDLRGKSGKDTESLVSELIGMDFETFCRTVYFPQEGTDPLGTLTDSALKEYFLDRFLDISWIGECYARARDDAKEKKSELERLEYRLEMERESYEEIRGEFVELQEEWKEKKDSVEKESARIQETIKTLYRDLEVVEKERDKVEKKLKRWDDDQKKLTHLGDRRHDVSRKEMSLSMALRQKEKELSESEAAIENYKERIRETESLIGGKCPECGTVLTKKHLPHYQKRLKDELKSCIKDRKKWEKEAKDIKSALDQVREEIAAIDKERETMEKRLSRGYAKALDLFRFYRQEDTRIRSEIGDQEWSLKEVQAVKTQTLRKLKELLDVKKKKTKELKAMKEEKESLQAEYGRIQFWVDAFSPSGIQSFLLENITPVVNRKIYKYLRILSDGKLGARFETQKVLKSGEKREKFSLEAWAKGGAQQYSLLSGGEKARIDAAVSLSLADTKRSLSGSVGMSLLILDEALGGLDEEGRNRLLDFLGKEFPDRPVFVVSHDYLRDSMFGYRHHVRKLDGKTIVETE